MKKNSNKKKKHLRSIRTFRENLRRNYSPFQRTMIYILICIAIVSIVLALYELGCLAVRCFSDEKQAQSSSASSSAVEKKEEDPVILAESEDAGTSYLDNTLFLGDSNTVRFMFFTDSEGKTYTSSSNTIAVVGMGAQAIDSLECEELSSGTVTMVDAVSVLKPQRIILSFGTNNLSGDSTDASEFISTYSEQVKKVQTASPSTHIIINSIFPVAEDTVYTKLSNKQIQAYNKALIQMCKDNGWHYLNSYEVLADSETGSAKDGMTDTDGLHLSKEGLNQLFTYIRTHALQVKGETEYAISNTDSIVKPLTTLYTTNPLTGGGFDESVLNPSEENNSESGTSSGNTSGSTPNSDAVETPPASSSSNTAAPSEQPTASDADASAAQSSANQQNGGTAEGITN
jgi:hypothetical protein